MFSGFLTQFPCYFALCKDDAVIWWITRKGSRIIKDWWWGWSWGSSPRLPWTPSSSLFLAPLSWDGLRLGGPYLPSELYWHPTICLPSLRVSCSLGLTGTLFYYFCPVVNSLFKFWSFHLNVEWNLGQEDRQLGWNGISGEGVTFFYHWLYLVRHHVSTCQGVVVEFLWWGKRKRWLLLP